MFNFLYELQKRFMRFFRNKQIVLLMAVVLLIVVCFLFDFIKDYKEGTFISRDGELVEKMSEIDYKNINNNNEENSGEFAETKNQEKEVSYLEENNNEEPSSEENNVESKDSIENSSELEMSVETNITDDLKNKILVYVTGEVNNSGVVSLKEGSRISDAINAAGGTTNKANISKINLVFVLEDGMKVNIPNDNDLKNNPDFEYITMGSGDGTVNSNVVLSNKDNLSSNGVNMRSTVDIVNINTATQTELETLPGIGPSLALKIINYRKENGKFSSIDDIKNVKGIGESKFEEIKNYISI